ncbi:hypothetical protein OSB04_028621 [Centaurea solstitialis]|uniref:SWIM-type domain-containing protein n=1 Tax=Centaurea solstitialis TaxID=347529 RepID=A0AA38SG46_9ASTR|nr:hypothetical protein OSB04_028621 [Centaurea solstitialis]
MSCKVRIEQLPDEETPAPKKKSKRKLYLEWHEETPACEDVEHSGKDVEHVENVEVTENVENVEVTENVENVEVTEVTGKDEETPAHVEVTPAHVEIPESIMNEFDPFFGINFDDDFDQPGRGMDDQVRGMNDEADRGMDEQPGRGMDDQARGMEDEVDDGMDYEVDDGTEVEPGMEDEVDGKEDEVDSGMVDEGNIIQYAVDVDVDMSNFNWTFVDGDIDGPCGDKNKKKQPTSVNFFVGQSFGSKAEVKRLVKLHAVETRRNIVILRNDKIRFRAVCKGKLPVFTTGTDSDKGKEVTSEETCPWVLHVSPVKKEETWMVKTYTDTHKCLQTRSVNACTASFLADHIVQTIAPNPEIPIRAVKEQLERKYVVSVSRVKSFRAKSMALNKLRGDYAQQYGLLRRYLLEVKRTNPDTTVKIDVEATIDPSSPTRQFKRVYICLGLLKQGFKACQRDLLGLDGCFMKGPYPGQILTAVGVDPNHGTYPLAYAVVEAETKKVLVHYYTYSLLSWAWFLECLGDDLGLQRNSNFTFISDRQKGIVPAITQVFPSAEHRYCLRHIEENMKLRFKGKAFKEHLWQCAAASTVPMFNKAMDELKAFNGSFHGWLRQIPPKHWSKAYFTGRCHCDIVLNNICEVFNAQLVNGRDKPIITALEYIRQYLMKKIVNVQKVIATHHGPLTPAATKMLDKIKVEAVDYDIIWNGGIEYEVSGPWQDQVIVNVQNKTCSCRHWELTGMPCKHAVATIWYMAMNGEGAGLSESWAHECYWLSTWKKVYDFKLSPINGPKLWPENDSPTTLTPPKHHIQVGRPKKKRLRTTDDASQSVVKGSKISKAGTSVTCAKCHNKGHNSRTCKVIFKAASTSFFDLNKPGIICTARGHIGPSTQPRNLHLEPCNNFTRRN